MAATLMRTMAWPLGILAIGIAVAWAGPPTVTLFQPAGDPPKDELTEPPTEEEPAPEESAGRFRKLTPQEINRIRYLELRAMRQSKLSEQPDRVTCKVPRDVIDEFLVEMEGREDFITALTGNKDAGWERARQAFNKMTAPQKLHQIAYYKGAKYADRVAITSDPEVFVEFKRNVLPVVMRSCATSSCHGLSAREGPRFILYDDPKKSASALYADFVMLNEIQVDGRPLIDRASPESSLLLTYMLPTGDVRSELRHTDAAKYKPIFQSRTARGYRLILEWIRSLKHPAEDYGVRFYPPPAPPPEDSLPADPPATQPVPASPAPSPQARPSP